MNAAEIESGRVERWLERYGNLIIYILIVGFGDLLQLWLFYVIYSIERRQMVLEDVVVDGSLFFYSATLFCSGIWHLITSPNRSARMIMYLVTLLIVVPCSIVTIASYTMEAQALIAHDEEINKCIEGNHFNKQCDNTPITQPPISRHDYMACQLIIAALAAGFAVAIVIWSECGHRPDDDKQPVRVDSNH